MGSETFRKTRGIFIFVKDLVVKLVKTLPFYLIMNNDKKVILEILKVMIKYFILSPIRRYTHR